MLVASLLSFTSAHAKDVKVKLYFLLLKMVIFLYDGKAIQLHSGEMHYARVPAPYWRHRFKMMKAMGLNAVATYVFWN